MKGYAKVKGIHTDVAFFQKKNSKIPSRAPLPRYKLGRQGAPDAVPDGNIKQSDNHDSWAVNPQPHHAQLALTPLVRFKTTSSAVAALFRPGRSLMSFSPGTSVLARFAAGAAPAAAPAAASAPKGTSSWPRGRLRPKPNHGRFTMSVPVFSVHVGGSTSPVLRLFLRFGLST